MFVSSAMTSIVQVLTYFVLIGINEALLPLTPDSDAVEHRNKVPGCKLGGKRYNLGDVWKPTLEPYGFMRCIKCRCAPIKKNSKSERYARKGKVSCRYIKQECPEADCENPVTLPGACCKTCPEKDEAISNGQTAMTFMGDSKTNSWVVGDASYQEFSTLMTGDNVTTHGVAKGRFQLQKSDLYFTVNYEKIRRPTHFWLVDDSDEVLFEQKISGNEQTGKICGLWGNIPDVFKNYLHRGVLTAVIATQKHPQGEVRAKIESRDTLSDETFAALLISREDTGIGGSAVFSTNEAGNMIDFHVKIKGFLRNEDTKTTIKVRFQKDKEIKKEFIVVMSNHDEVFSDVWTNLKTAESRQFARAKYKLVIVTASGKTISGRITPRSICNTLQSVLSGAESMEKTMIGAAGSAVLTYDNHGKIHYKIFIGGLDSRLTGLTIEYATKKETKRVTNAKRSFSKIGQKFDGWANGTISKTKVEHFYMLLRHRFFINVATVNNDVSALHGRVTELLFNPEIDTSRDFPVLLSGVGVNPSRKVGAAGHAWLVLSAGCTLHYQMVIKGLSTESGESTKLMTSYAELGQYIDRGTGPVVAKPKSRKVTSSSQNKVQMLKGFIGEYVKGSAEGLEKSLFEAMNEGEAFLQIATKTHPQGEIIGQVKLENQCALFDSSIVMGEEGKDNQDDVDKYKCMYSGKMYDDGARWTPDPDAPCRACSCIRGTTACHEMQCPTVACDNPVTIEGECCPKCDAGSSNESATVVGSSVNTTANRCFFNGDQRYHAYGTKWHPYIPPFGFVRCAVCSCKGDGTEETDCHRIECPALTCPEAEAYRRNQTDCCRVCPDSTAVSRVVNKDSSVLGDSPDAKACLFGKSRIPDGTHWNPKVGDFGTIRCVTCRCKAGEIKCQKKKCPKLPCPRRLWSFSKDQCCPKCSADARSSKSKKNNNKGKRRKGRGKKSSKRKSRGRSNKKQRNKKVNKVAAMTPHALVGLS
ncbi:chordin-like [Tubulanus polymorphus]|uniref:chordin-like n=1 Tax=Tubulanus polymorphus TaxID=672921 RepID=UPI003DA42DFD